MRIGIMGGTFNPIHTGHLMLAEWAMEEAKLDRVLFIPTGNSYMKESNEILESAHRLAMASIAVASNPCFDVSGMEIERGGNTYTCDTLKQLHEEMPENDIFFIMGADCLFTIEKWKNPEQIFKSCHLIAAARNGSSIASMEAQKKKLEQRFGAKILLLQFPEIALSSTDIRNRMISGKSIRYLVPEGVREYILENQLYR